MPTVTFPAGSFSQLPFALESWRTQRLSEKTFSRRVRTSAQSSSRIGSLPKTPSAMQEFRSSASIPLIDVEDVLIPRQSGAEAQQRPHLLGNHLLVGVSQKRDCPIGCGLLRRAIFYAHLAQSVPENQSKTQRILLMHADRFSQTRSSSNDAMSQRYEEEGHCAADRCIAATRQLSAVA